MKATNTSIPSPPPWPRAAENFFTEWGLGRRGHEGGGKAVEGGAAGGGAAGGGGGGGVSLCWF